ncbi:SDR family oxidoreductase [Streptomyces triculaminicus]|uniref:SDR family oxidoreductase n=1 Tax=Streptomyces triculaminicus TaxID=2816232 RepID=UPI0037CEE5AB
MLSYGQPRRSREGCRPRPAGRRHRGRACTALGPGGRFAITSASGRTAFPGTAGLAAVNGALAAMVPPLAVELAPLRVNAVSPGVIDTPWWDQIPEEQREALFHGLAAPPSSPASWSRVYSLLPGAAGATLKTPLSPLRGPGVVGHLLPLGEREAHVRLQPRRDAVGQGAQGGVAALQFREEAGGI